MTALIATAAVLALAGPAAAQACPGANLTPDVLSSAQAGDAVVCLMNQTRRSHGVSKLRQDTRLERAAQYHSEAMDAYNFFSHNSPSGSSPVSRIENTGFMSGARSWGIAENIRWGDGALGTPKSAVTAWMRSAPHRASMLSSRYRLVGIGVALGAPDGDSANAAIYTADFGYRH